jgi:hypothetical protein
MQNRPGTKEHFIHYTPHRHRLLEDSRKVRGPSDDTANGSEAISGARGGRRLRSLASMATPEEIKGLSHKIRE